MQPIAQQMQKYSRNTEKELQSHIFPHKKTSITHFSAKVEKVKAGCCRGHVEIFICVKCDICKISERVKIGRLLKYYRVEEREPLVTAINKLTELHRKAHRIYDHPDSIINKRLGEKRYDMNSMHAGNADEFTYTCEFCGVVFNAPLVIPSVQFRRNRDIMYNRGFTKMISCVAIKHIMRECNVFAERFDLQPLELLNNSQMHSESMKIINECAGKIAGEFDYNLVKIAGNRIPKIDELILKYYVGSEISSQHILNEINRNNFLFEVRLNACGGMYLATCKICKEVRAYKSYHVAAQSVYYQIMTEHFLTPKRKLCGNSTDFIFPAVMNLKSERTEVEYDQYRPDNKIFHEYDVWEEYYTEKLNWSCILCLQEYDVGIGSHGQIQPPNDAILGHFKACLAEHIQKGRDSIRMIVGACMHVDKYSESVEVAALADI